MSLREPGHGTRLGPSRHALVAPELIWTALFFLAPLGLIVLYSLASWDIVSFRVSFGWTLENYRGIVDSVYLEAIGRSLMLSVTATLICLVVAFPVALAISRQPRRRQVALLLLVMIPFWTSFVVRTYGVANVLAPDGPLDRLTGIGSLLYTPTAVVIGIVYTYLPLMILPLYVALERIDPALLEAARDLGAPGRSILRRVLLPLAMPGIAAGCVLVGVPAIGEYVIPAILGGDRTLVYGNVVANQFLGVGDYPFGSAIAVTLMAAVTLLVLVSRRRWAADRELGA